MEYVSLILFLIVIFMWGYLFGHYSGFNKAHRRFVKMRKEWLNIIEDYKKELKKVRG